MARTPTGLAICMLLWSTSAATALGTGNQPSHVVFASLWASDSACVVKRLSAERLVVEGGRQLYVEPVSLASSAGDVFLGGSPNYLWERKGDEWDLVGRGTVVGAILHSDGTARTIPFPSGGVNYGEVRARGRTDGSWDVILAERASAEFPPDPVDTLVRLWYGRYDGREWTEVEPLPVPPNAVLLGNAMTLLEGWADTLVIAVPAAVPNYRRHAIIYTRQGATWTYEEVPTHPAGYLSIAHSKSDGLLLAFVGPDMSVPRPSFDVNSLFLWRRGSSWQRVGRLVHGSLEGPVDHPSLSVVGERITVSWSTTTPNGSEARAIPRVRLDGSNDRPVVLDDALRGSGKTTLIALPYGGNLWVTNHQPSTRQQREIHFVVVTNSGASVIHQLTSPFLGGFGTTQIGDSQILLSGALWDPVERMAVSLILRMSVSCASS